MSSGFSFSPVEGAVGRWEATVPSGTYWLIETAAPDGHMALVESVEVIVDAAGRATLAHDAADDGISLSHEDAGPVVQIVNYAALRLPATGGVGARQVSVIGLAVLVITATGAVAWRRRDLTTK